jgi:hypothetical protein
MKCSNPNCNNGIGLVSHQRGWFVKHRHCSRKCRDTFVAERVKPLHRERRATTYFEWLFEHPVSGAQLRPVPAFPRIRTRDDFRPTQC